jgi:hypothetical protein
MYIFYIDETGNLDTKGIHPGMDEKYSKKDWLYVLTGLGIFEHKWRKFYDPIAAKKRELLQGLGTPISLDECEIKSNWIRIEKERNNHPFLSLLSEADVNDLIKTYYRQLLSIPAAIVSVVIDKRYLQNFMDASKLHRKAWELLCERIENFMRERHPKHKAILVTDDVTKQANLSLARKHAYFLESGTSANCMFKQIIEMPLFVRSELSEGIQAADLCSYNVYHVMRYQKMVYPYFDEICPLFYNSSNTKQGKLDGLKIFPEKSPLLQWWEEKKKPLCRGFI